MNDIDPVLLSVYARTFKSITDEMSISVEKTTRSPILCEAKDFVTGLYDAEGRCLDQPLEPAESLFKEKTSAKAYPVQEMGGLVWAYLGPAPAPQEGYGFPPT